MEEQPTLIEEICIAQATDPRLERIRKEVLVGKAHRFMIYGDGTIRFYNQVRVSAVEDLKKKILDESHNTPLSIHWEEISCIRI